ncbi:MAG: hypothetical protein ABIN91_23720 [Mucilaginibacter sp.]|uniref:hypothetical protein n=1 Tax=Mucilaginibacter sp. TaxID=1882438 RepID=UPI0032662118
MKAQKNIEELVDETLNTLNGIQPVEANNFLFGKIQNRMQMGSCEQVARIKMLSRLSAALLLFIGLNVGSYYFLSGNSQKPQSVQQKTTPAQAFASEYHLSGSQYNY